MGEIAQQGKACLASTWTCLEPQPQVRTNKQTQQNLVQRHVLVTPATKSPNWRMTAEIVLSSPQDAHKPTLVCTHKHTCAYKSINQSINSVWNLWAFFVSTMPKSLLLHQSPPIPELSWADSLLVTGSFISSLRSPNNGLLFQFLWFAGVPVGPTFCLQCCELL